MSLLLFGAPDFSGALDIFQTNLEWAWSTGRRLRTSYTGNIIRVRRSTDNTESNFGYLPNGDVNISAIVSFCGTGNGFLTTIYDQSGLARNLIQPTTTLQPQVVVNGVPNTQNGKLIPIYNGATNSRSMYVNSSTGMFKFMHDGTSSTMYSVHRVNDNSGSKTLLNTRNAPSDTGFTIFYDSTERQAFIVFNAGAIAVNPSAISGITSPQILTQFVDADNIITANRESAWRNGTLISGNNTANTAVNTGNSTRIMQIGTNGSAGVPFDGWISEMAMWSIDMTTSRSIFEQSARTFWGF